MARIVLMLSTPDLAPVWPVEEDPHDEIVRDVLETVLRARRDEQEVPSRKRITLAVVQEDALAAGDDVDLILRVRRKLAGPDGSDGQSGVERPMSQEADRVLVLSGRDGSANVGQMDHPASARARHSRAHLPMRQPPRQLLAVSRSTAAL
jgi:hypothetical protein